MDPTITQDPFAIPYCLDTLEAVMQAKSINFLNLHKDYSLMKAAAKNIPLQYPPALEKAKKAVVKDFYVLREQNEQVEQIDYRIVANINLVDNYQLIVKSIPWVIDLAKKQSLFQALQEFPDDIQSMVKVNETPATMTALFESVVSTIKMNKHEIFTYVNSKRANKLKGDDLKKLITARAIFEPANGDVLEALRHDAGGDSGALAQHACAELLFVRIPALLEPMCRVNPRVIRERLFAKIAKLGTTPQQRMALFGYFKADVTADKLIKTMNKVSAIGAKILETQKAETLHDYISSLNQKLEFEQKVYEHLFLSPELVRMRKLHVPGRVMKTRYTYYDKIVTARTLVESLSFYPVKCYLDISKYRSSKDCTGTGLAEQHLATKNYFSIRIFKNSRWLGNIYMLDFTQEHDILIVDRIQVPRDLKAEYLAFYDYLKEVFEEMFMNLPHSRVLLPRTLSNHGTIQKVYNIYKKRLEKIKFYPTFNVGPHFESLQDDSFVVLCDVGVKQ